MRNFLQQTEDFNDRLIKRKQGNMPNVPSFAGGMQEDIANPRSTALRSLEDYLCFADRLEGRGGSKVWSNTALPALVGRTGYSLSKSATTVTKTAGTDFAESDVGNYIVYDDGKHERISAFISATQVTVDRSTAHVASTAAWLHGAVNMVAKHRKNNRIIIQIDTRLFISSSITIAAWYQVFQAGGTAPANSYSRYDEMGDYLMVFNANGIFKLDCAPTGDGADPCIYWMINEPFVGFSGHTATSPDNDYKYRYMFARTRITGTSYTRNRTDSYMEQQTAPLILVEASATNTKADYIEMDFAAAIVTGSRGALDFVFSAETRTPYTHWSIYRTMDIGTNGTNPQTGEGNKTELFVWVRDVPIKRGFTASRSGTTLTATTDVFTAEDVGARIYYNGDGTYTIIASYTNSKVVETAQTGTIASTAMAIGTANQGTAVQAVLGTETIGNATVTKSAGTNFASTAVGDEIVWPDGKRSLIVRYVGTTVVEVAQSDAISSTSMAWGSNGCIVQYDGLEDVTLRARSAGFSVKNRFMDPLPNCEDGAIGGGMLWGIDRGTGNVYYCQIPNNEEYYAGFYRSAGDGAQFDIIPDSIQAVRAFTDRIVFYCSQTTWFISCNNFSSVVLPEVGEVIVIATGHWPIADIGVIDYGSICKIDGVQKSKLVQGMGDLMVCSDGGARICNGAGFSGDIAIGRIRKTLLAHSPRSAANYDPINGVLLYRSDNTRNDATHAYCFGIEPEVQGTGWYKYLNGDPVLPFARMGGIVVLDGNNHFHSIVLDAYTGLFYEIATYDGPTGASLSRIWKDKVASDGTGGTTITPAVEFIPERAEEEENSLEHLESHLFTRPYDRSSGYPAGLAFTLKIYVDTTTTVKAQAASVTQSNDVKFDKKVEGYEMYIRVEANMSEHSIVGRSNAFKAKDKSASPAYRTTAEAAYQKSLSNVLLWLSPFLGKVINRVNGATVVASPTLTTGPDGYSDSGAQISAALSCGSVNANGKPLFIWADGTVAITVGGTSVALTSHGTSGGFTLYYGTPTSNGAVVVTPTGTRVIADLRVLDEALSTAARTYYFEDVDDNDGKVVMPR